MDNSEGCGVTQHRGGVDSVGKGGSVVNSVHRGSVDSMDGGVDSVNRGVDSVNRGVVGHQGGVVGGGGVGGLGVGLALVPHVGDESVLVVSVVRHDLDAAVGELNSVLS